VQLTRVSADSLHLGELAHLGGSLNILEVDILVFAEVDNAAKVVEQTFSSLVLLEKINQSGGAK
jgi:hypothetical protein